MTQTSERAPAGPRDSPYPPPPPTGLPPQSAVHRTAGRACGCHTGLRPHAACDRREGDAGGTGGRGGARRSHVPGARMPPCAIRTLRLRADAPDMSACGMTVHQATLGLCMHCGLRARARASRHCYLSPEHALSLVYRRRTPLEMRLWRAREGGFLEMCARGVPREVCAGLCICWFWELGWPLTVRAVALVWSAARLWHADEIAGCLQRTSGACCVGCSVERR